MEVKMIFDRDMHCEPHGRMHTAEAKVKNTFLQFPVDRFSISTSLCSKSEGGTASTRESSPTSRSEDDIFGFTQPAMVLEPGRGGGGDVAADGRGICSVPTAEELLCSKQFSVDLERGRNGCGGNMVADRHGICSVPIEEVGTPIVKNTFIECYIRARPTQRRKSLPASLRLSLPECGSSSGLQCSFAPSEVCSIPGTDVESSQVEEEDDIADDKACSTEGSSFHSFQAPFPSERSAGMRTAEHFATVITEASSTLESSDLIASVETSFSSHDCTILLRACGGGASAAQILTLARQAFRNAAGKSQVVYVLGYCGQKMTAITPLGFEVTLGSMENAKLACWHIFKKGFCRHGEDCRRQHPSHTLPVKVLLELAQFEAPSAKVHDFKLKVDSVVRTVADALQQSPSVSRAIVCEDHTSEGWTIEVSPSNRFRKHQEDTLIVAKNALLDTTFGSQVALMGHDAQPFAPNSHGFTAVLGNKRTSGKSCVKLYAAGVCYRGCTCHFDHPNCLTPIRIAIKPN